MTSLLFILCLSITITIDCILLKLTENIKDITFFYLSLGLIMLSLFISCIILFFIWLFQNKQVTRLIIANCFFIKKPIIIYFVTIHYYGGYAEPYFGLLYFVNFIFSFMVLLLHRTANIEPLRIVPLESIVIDQPCFEPNCCMLKDTTCSICMEDMLYKEYAHITHCKHYFHIKCLNKLFESGLKCCPNCRTKL